MKTEGFTEGRNLLLIKNSKWHDRVFRSVEEIQKLPRRPGDYWQYNWPSEAPIFDAYFYLVGSSRIFQDCMKALGTCTGNKSATEYLCSSYGKEGEAYQDAFDACFCEEMFVPLATEPELVDGWNTVTVLTVFEPGKEYEVTWWPTIAEIGSDGSEIGPFKQNEIGYFGFDSESHFVTDRPTFWRYPKANGIVNPDNNWYLFDEHKPYDRATCDLCYSTQEITDQEWQTAEYRHWISHPGGEATANAGPGFTDEYGFPAYEDPIWWRYTEDLPPLPEEKYKSVTKEIVDDYIEDAMAAPLIADTKGPELDLEGLENIFYNPEAYQSSSKPTPSEDDDYYLTI